MLKKIKEQLPTEELFYNNFYQLPEGLLTFKEAQRLFPYYNEDNSDKDEFVDFVLEHMQDWLFNQLTDDEMDSAYTWFETMTPILYDIIRAGTT